LGIRVNAGCGRRAKIKKLVYKACEEVALKVGALKTQRSDKSVHPGMEEWKEMIPYKLSDIEKQLDAEE
jgi:hypothetical protein